MLQSPKGQFILQKKSTMSTYGYDSGRDLRWIDEIELCEKKTRYIDSRFPIFLGPLKHARPLCRGPVS